MERVGLVNVILGFWWIFLASCGGFFLAQYRLHAYILDRPQELLQWWMVLQKSAHAHTNLFGMMHILTGLTMSYSLVPPRGKILQTVGLGLGSLSMSVLAVVHSRAMPETYYSTVSVLMGMGLSLWLVSVVVHIVGLTMKWQGRWG